MHYFWKVFSVFRYISFRITFIIIPCGVWHTVMLWSFFFFFHKYLPRLRFFFFFVVQSFLSFSFKSKPFTQLALRPRVPTCTHSIHLLIYGSKSKENTKGREVEKQFSKLKLSSSTAMVNGARMELNSLICSLSLNMNNYKVERWTQNRKTNKQIFQKGPVIDR